MADYALNIVTPKVLVMLFFCCFSEVKTQPCNFWRKVYDTNLYCSFKSSSERLSHVRKMCSHTALKAEGSQEGNFESGDTHHS